MSSNLFEEVRQRILTTAPESCRDDRVVLHELAGPEGDTMAHYSFVISIFPNGIVSINSMHTAQVFWLSDLRRERDWDAFLAALPSWGRRVPDLNRFDALRAIWKKENRKERPDFLDWLGALKERLS